MGGFCFTSCNQLARADFKLIMHNKKSIGRNIVLSSAWKKSRGLTEVYVKIIAVAFWFFFSVFCIFKKIEYVKQNIHFFTCAVVKTKEERFLSVLNCPGSVLKKMSPVLPIVPVGCCFTWNDPSRPLPPVFFSPCTKRSFAHILHILFKPPIPSYAVASRHWKRCTNSL